MMFPCNGRTNADCIARPRRFLMSNELCKSIDRRALVGLAAKFCGSPVIVEMAIVAENFRQETWILRYSHECGQTGDSRIGAPPSGRPIKCAVLGAGRRTSQFMSGF